MIKFILILTMLPLLQVVATPSKIYGSWQSDSKATTSYLEKYAVLNDYQKKFFGAFFGHSTITYNEDGTGSITTKAHVMPMKDGSELKIPETKVAFTFKLLGESKSQLVVEIKTDKSLFEDYPFSLIKFHGADSFSVSLSDSITEINGREFFKRIKQEDRK